MARSREWVSVNSERVRAHRGEAPGRAVVEVKLRRPVPAYHLDAHPVHAAGVAGAERLHGRFLGGEPGGERRRRIPLAPAVGLLACGKEPPDEPVAVTGQRLRHAPDLDGVEAASYNVHWRCPSYMSLPAVPDGFYWSEAPWGPVLRCRPLDGVARHAFTSRHLKLSPTEGASELAATVGVGAVAQLAQVHGKAVAMVRPGAGWRLPWPEADVLVSRDPATAVAVRAADCVPLLMADPVTGAVAAVHAGWRGTAAGAAVAAVDALAREHGAAPGRLDDCDRPLHRQLLLRGRHRAGGRVRGGRPRAVSHRSLVPGAGSAARLTRAAPAASGPRRRQSRSAHPGRRRGSPDPHIRAVHGDAPGGADVVSRGGGTGGAAGCRNRGNRPGSRRRNIQRTRGTGLELEAV